VKYQSFFFICHRLVVRDKYSGTMLYRTRESVGDEPDAGYLAWIMVARDPYPLVSAPVMDLLTARAPSAEMNPSPCLLWACAASSWAPPAAGSPPPPMHENVQSSRPRQPDHRCPDRAVTILFPKPQEHPGRPLAR
jgi:hypothetical protein